MNGRRVAFVAPSAYPLGGVAVWLDYLVPGLARLGWDPVVLLASGPHHDHRAYLAEHPGLAPVAVAVDNPTGSRQGRIESLKAALRVASPQLVAGVNIPDAYAAVNAIGGTATANVMTLHGLQPDLMEDVHSLRRCLDAVVVTNKLAARLVQAQGVAGERVFYAPYGVTLHGEVSRAHGERLRVAFVGRLESWQKRVFDIEGIADRLHAMGVGFEIVIAGSGPCEEELRERMRAHTIAGRARFLGPVAADELHAKVYSHSDVLLITSSWETGPIVAWEAMASGVAVVSSRYVGCGLEGALADGENCILFPVGDCDAAAAALASLQSEAARSRIARAGAALVDSRYTLEASIASWDRALQAIAGRPAIPKGIPCGPAVASSGRLDRWLGPHWGEKLRKSLGRAHAHHDAGGEWPHSYGERGMDDPAFWQGAARADGVPVPDGWTQPVRTLAQEQP